MALSVFVVDKDRVLAELLARHVQSSSALVKGATSVNEALGLLAEAQPQVLLLNPEVDRADEFMNRMLTDWPRTSLILLEDEAPLAERTVPGVAGIVSKRQSLRQFVASVETVVSRKLNEPEEASPGDMVLVVDDDPAIGQLFCTMLGRRGHRVETTTTAAEVLPMLARSPDIRVVLLDLIIAPDGGMETLRHVSQLAEPPAVIIVSGVTDADIAKHALFLGAFAYLTKPISESELIDTVERALASR